MVVIMHATIIFMNTVRHWCINTPPIDACEGHTHGDIMMSNYHVHGTVCPSFGYTHSESCRSTHFPLCLTGHAMAMRENVSAELKGEQIMGGIATQAVGNRMRPSLIIVLIS